MTFTRSALILGLIVTSVTTFYYRGTANHLYKNLQVEAQKVLAQTAEIEQLQQAMAAAETSIAAYTVEHKAASDAYRSLVLKAQTAEAGECKPAPAINTVLDALGERWRAK